MALVGCGGKGLPSAPSPSDPAARLANLTELDQRVARVAIRLLEENVDLCPTVRQSAGWTLHAANQYSDDLRPYAEEVFDLAGDLPGVLVAPSGSAAAEANVHAGDLILAVNGQSLSEGVAGDPATFEGLERNIVQLDLALAMGPTELLLRNDGVTRSVTIEPHRACGYEVQLDPSDTLNARADGRRLFISSALAQFASSDDELAIILGHELAHHVLGHRVWADIGGSGRVENDAVPVSASGGREHQADRIGLFLAARAGFDTTVGPAFWRRFGDYSWLVRIPQLRHETAEARARHLELVQAEIDGKRRRGDPLLP